jgi:hypothetical protein
LFPVRANLRQSSFLLHANAGIIGPSHWSMAMTMRPKVFAWIVVACTVGLVAGIGTPATAGQYWSSDPGSHGGHWRETHRAIYRLENLIALLEADPATDDGFKAPIITRARADIRRLRATLDRSRWRWTTPCCYSRRPIYIR